MSQMENTSVLDAESAVISIVLNNPDEAYSLGGLRYFMFSSTPHQELFSVIEDFIESQTTIDPGLLITKLEATGKLNSVGGKAYLEQLLTLNPNPSTLKDYKEIVISSYKARSLSALASKLSGSRLDISKINDTIEYVKRSLDDLSEIRGGSQTIKLGDKVKEFYEEIVKRQENPGIRGVTWGIPSLDKVTGGKCPGEVIIISGRPGAGKTAFVCNSILADAKAGVPVLLFEREMRNQDIAERLLSLMTGIPITNIRLGVLNQSQVTQIFDALKEIKNYPIFIDTSYRNSDSNYIEATVQKYKRLYDIKVVYLDYLQILSERDENQTHELGRITRLFKSLSNELGISSVLLSQLNRNVESRENKRPMLSDLRQSGNLEEDADIVVGLYRDEYYDKESKYKGLMEYIILKYRNGPVGTITLGFDSETNLITEA